MNSFVGIEVVEEAKLGDLIEYAAVAMDTTNPDEIVTSSCGIG